MKCKAIISTVIFLFSLCYCKNYGENISDKVYFHIHKNSHLIMIPVMLSDSIQANWVFDTGGSLTIDSTFCAQNKINLGKPVETFLSGIAWTKEKYKTYYYTSPIKVKIGNKTQVYNTYTKLNFKDLISSNADGLINFPKDDSAHVWELNFEKGYLQIYPDSLFIAPNETSFFPMEILKYGRYYVTMPISIVFSDGHTMKRKWRCIIDTGMSWDIALVNNAPEANILNQRKNAIWTADVSGYNRHYEATATVFGKFKIDSLRLYTFSYYVGTPAKYILGTNFLKHFNVFFDLKNKRLGLQPINNYHRIFLPLARRYHIRINPGADGKNIITHIANYENNYYKKAGFKVGDEVISIDGIKYNRITTADNDRITKMDSIRFVIRRNGKIKEITVHVDKSEKQGD